MGAFVERSERSERSGTNAPISRDRELS
jgi:hypothetical protein